MIDRQLDLALQAGDRLSDRSATLAGLLGATLGLVAAGSIAAVRHFHDFGPTFRIVLAALFVVILCSLSASAVYALAVVRPSAKSVKRFNPVIDALGRDCFPKREMRQLASEALSDCCAENRLKAKRLAWACASGGVGIALIFVATAFYCAAYPA